LVTDGNSSKIMFNALNDTFNIQKIIIEEDVSKKTLLKNRVKRLGLLKVIGQVIFILFNKILSKLSKKQISHLKEKYLLDDSYFQKDLVKNVKSVNSAETKEIIESINPDIIIVNGTRIISEEILLSTKATFLNTHAGVTPKYRGVHGGYWALTQKDYENCGVTVHLVDKGIDTGGILYQDTIVIDKNDNFNTYPYHQIAKAIPLMKSAIEDVINDSIKIVKRDDLKSQIWSHPSIYEYIKYRVLLGVK
ncbi:MAG TPA: formyl transferase, partial [Campylobacterales bacterium]|nr:formyl transferase [Campylobacterales bacterium]